jgi:anti-sigma B factor antagonist
MDMHVSELPGQAVGVELVGRLDTMGVNDMETRFNAAVIAGGKNALVDLSGLDFVSSMGVRLLITAAKSMKARQQRLLLVVPAGPVREMLETAAIDTLIPMFITRDEALAALVR